MLSRVQLSETPRAAARQTPLSVGFPRKQYWSGCHFLLQGIFPTQGPNPRLLLWQAGSLPLSLQGSPTHPVKEINKVAQRVTAGRQGRRTDLAQSGPALTAVRQSESPWQAR